MFNFLKEFLRGGFTMKKLCLLCFLALSLVSCAHFNHSESIDVDHAGATGKYQDSRAGCLYRFGFFAAGGGGGGDGLGLGGIGWWIDSSQAESDPTAFANAIAKINYSKKLKSVKYDEVSGVRSYEFADPATKSSKSSVSLRETFPPSYGQQPVD